MNLYEFSYISYFIHRAVLIVFITLYVTFLVFILYLEVCSTFSCLYPLCHPSPQPQPAPLVTTYLTSFPMSLIICLFVFEV